MRAVYTHAIKLSTYPRTFAALSCGSDNTYMDMEIVIDGVRDLMRRHDFATPTALARAVGVPQPTIARLFYRTHETVRLETLQALAVYFRVTVSQLTGELPLEPDEQIAHVQQVMQTLPEYKKGLSGFGCV